MIPSAVNLHLAVSSIYSNHVKSLNLAPTGYYGTHFSIQTEHMYNPFDEPKLFGNLTFVLNFNCDSLHTSNFSNICKNSTTSNTCVLAKFPMYVNS